MISFGGKKSEDATADELAYGFRYLMEGQIEDYIAESREVLAVLDARIKSERDVLGIDPQDGEMAIHDPRLCDMIFVSNHLYELLSVLTMMERSWVTQGGAFPPPGTPGLDRRLGVSG